MDAVFKPLNDAALDTILGNGAREIYTALRPNLVSGGGRDMDTKRVGPFSHDMGGGDRRAPKLDDLEDVDSGQGFHEIDLDEIGAEDGWVPDLENPDDFLEYLPADSVRALKSLREPLNNAMASRLSEWLAIIGGQPKSEPMDEQQLERWQYVAVEAIRLLTPAEAEDTAPTLLRAALESEIPTVQGAALLGLHAIGLGQLVKPIQRKLKRIGILF